MLGQVLTLGLLVVLQGLAAPSTPHGEKKFRLHLNTEPSSLVPWEQKSSSAGYLLSQVYGSLLKFQDNQLLPSLAEDCHFENPKLISCKIAKDASFSDGSAIQAEDFKRAWLEFLKPENHAFRADLFFPIKNAEAYFLGKVKADQVGLSSKGKELLITLEKPDNEFLFTLTSPLLTPLKSLPLPALSQASSLISSGAFRIKKWLAHERIELENTKTGVLVEFVFIQEDTVALNLYQKKELQFLRRLPTLFIPKYRGQKDFHQIAQSRLDYFGFGPQLDAFPELRQALTHSLDFSEVQKLLFSEGEFGCPGLPDQQLKIRPCLKFDLKAAKENLAVAMKKGPLPKLSLHFSKQGGEDHKRVGEWIQSQWKKNLNLNVELVQVENKLFVENLKTAPPPIFRKGITPERPTCRSALEYFLPESSENFLRLSRRQDKRYFENLEKMTQASVKAETSQELCSDAALYLNESAKWIPTGLIHFTILADPHWVNWRLNDLNQLDLSELRYQEL